VRPEVFRGRRPGDRVGERWTVLGRVPLHDHQLDRHAETFRLAREPVHEHRDTVQKIAAVVVVARGCDDGEVRLVHWTPFATALSTRQRCRTSTGSSCSDGKTPLSKKSAGYTV